MPLLKLSESKLKPVVILVSSVYFIFTALFFLNLNIPHKITFCVAVLTIASLWLCPWQITLALLFSTLGDYMGSVPNFLGQILCFGCAHVFYFIYFFKRYFSKVEPDRKLTEKAIGYLILMILSALVLCAFLIFRILPGVPDGLVRIFILVYTSLILSMYIMAMLQRSSLYALAAVLFVFSDFMIAWHRFVEPVPYRDYVVLVTYFLAQWLFFIRSTPYRLSRQIRLLRF